MKTVPLRRLISSIDNGAWGNDPGSGGVDVPCIRAADFDFVALRVKSGSAPLRAINPRAAHRLMLRPGDIVLEKSGGGDAAPVGRSVLFDDATPAVTSNFAARVRPSAMVESRFLNYLLYSLYCSGATVRCIKQTTGIQNLDTQSWLQTPVRHLDAGEQRRIADFLDERVARIDQIIAARHEQRRSTEELAARYAYEIIVGSGVSERRESDLPWLDTLPSDWPVLPVGGQFKVDLGKMLNENRQTGADSVPYLRNTNVQWDQIAVDNLKSMDIAASELERYTVRPGDLLICEGGQPGRAAIWEGGIEVLGFQKALHRARSLGRSHPGWLLECLRVAVSLNVFAVENEQTTIGHLTNEQLRATRFPFPEPSVQKAGVDRLRTLRASSTRSREGLERSMELLREYKQSLITAAVTGELDVTTASTKIPGE